MLPLLMAFLLLQPGPGAAGRVVRRAGTDTVPAPGAMVLLHRVGPVEQGAIDSVAADAAGRFAFQFVRDTGAAYLVSARWAGIEYFAPCRHGWRRIRGGHGGRHRGGGSGGHCRTARGVERAGVRWDTDGR